MPFDHIIMNPPYSGNLHLKILREAMKHIEKEGGEITNLSPIRWLQDPLAEYKRGSDWKKFEDIRSHIADVKIIPQEDFYKLFDVQFNTNVGIYYLTENGGMDLDSLVDMNFKKIYIKVMAKAPKEKPIVTTYGKCAKNNFVPVCLLGGHVDVDGFGVRAYRDRYWYFVDGKCQNPRFLGQTFEECKSYNMMSPDKMTVVEFETPEETKNYYEYLRTNFFSYLTKKHTMDGHIYLNMLPFLPTYKKPWTDADLFEYFKLNKEEIATIEEEMK